MTKGSTSTELSTLILDHAGMIHKLSYLYSNSREEYEDLQQEISYQILKSYPKFNNKSKLSTWVYKVALFTALAFLRKRKKQLVYTTNIPEWIAEEEDDNWPEVLSAIKALPDVEKSLIFLYLEDHSYKEMANITGLTESNIGVRLNRIKNKLKSKLNQA